MDATVAERTDTPLRGLLQHAFGRFERALQARLGSAFGAGNGEPGEMGTEAGPRGDDSPYGRFVREHRPDAEAELLLMLALAPCVRPDFFDRALQKVRPGAGEYPQFGGIRGRQHRGFLPTGDTALFLLAGLEIVAREQEECRVAGGQEAAVLPAPDAAELRVFAGDHPFVARGIVVLEEPADGEPRLSGRLVLDGEYLERFLGGRVRAPRLSLRFPAQRIETALEWDDVVLSPRTLAEVRELEHWTRYGQVLLDDWGMRRKLRPGCRALFFGPPGTGKTLTATLLGKQTGREVYKVDLSMVISKFIGETEKNLAALFDRAEHKDWILFFDEADALFGKRTQVRDAHDRYANQEVSFLLQRIETFNGLVILASNLASHVDEAFARRFELLVHFPMPRQNERLLLWKKGLPAVAALEAGTDLAQIAARHELSGGMIMNVIRHASLKAIARGENVLRAQDLQDGIRREYGKENRLE